MEKIITNYFEPLAAGVAKAFFTSTLVTYEDLEADALVGCWQAKGHFKKGKLAAMHSFSVLYELRTKRG